MIKNNFEWIPKKERKKILILSDDIRTPSGVGTMTREIIRQTCHRFNYVQLGAVINHPDNGKRTDMSDDFNNLSNYKDTSVIVYAHQTYGNADILRNLILQEEPDGILIYTDPRYWTWLFEIEYEIRRKIPIFYYNIWDNTPAPFYNKAFYKSCNLLMNISRQTHALVKDVLHDNYYDIYSKQADNNYKEHNTIVSYIPHGINHNIFRPLNNNEIKTSRIYEILKETLSLKDNDIVFFVNNRNIRRKKLSDIIIAFNEFSKKYKFDKKYKLLLHTDIVDRDGTDLKAVKDSLAPNANIFFSNKKIGESELNILYNIASVTINIANAEGFGLTTAESLMAGTPIIVNVTGGLQDQCGFKKDDNTYLNINDYDNNFNTNAVKKYEKHGEWAFPIFPQVRTLVGSVPTPYIYEDTINTNDLVNTFDSIIKKETVDSLKEKGLKGRDFLMSTEIGMTAIEMGNRFIESMTFALANYTPRVKYTIENI